MPKRYDSPPNAVNFLPWTLDLTTLNAVAVPPSTAAAEGECPANSIDVRGMRGFSIELEPGTVTGSSCLVELQWSNSGRNFISMGTAYQIAIPAGTPSAPTGWIVLNGFYQWIKVVVIGAASGGSAKIVPDART